LELDFKMINKTQAERLAASTHALRPDWPVNSLMTLLAELRDWPLRDLACALAWIATDQDADGNYITQSPARIKQQGPWIEDADKAAALIQARQKAAADAAERKREIRQRQAATARCTICDHEGRLADGGLCRHDTSPDERAAKAKAHADQARVEVKPIRIGRTPEEIAASLDEWAAEVAASHAIDR
jgi:hypothetical protein